LNINEDSIKLEDSKTKIENKELWEKKYRRSWRTWTRINPCYLI